MPVEPPISSQRAFEDLSLLDLLTLLVVRPGGTWGALRDTLREIEQTNAEIAPRAAAHTRIRSAYVDDYATKPTLPTLPVIDWRALRPLLTLARATLIALGG